MAMLTGLEMQYTSNPKFINKNGRIIAYNVAIFLFSFVASSKRKTIKNKKLVKASDVIDNLYSKTYDKIMQTLKYNVVKTKNKYSKMYKEQKLHSMVAFDSLMFGPSIREDIKDDYIKIILPGDKNYKNVKKEDIVI